MALHPSVKQLGELTIDLAEKKASWIRNLLLLASSLFGILVSLQSKNDVPVQIRLYLASALVLLALGIIFATIYLYSEVEYRKRAKDLFQQESIKALHEDRPVQPVFVNPIKIFILSEKASYVCFLLAIIALAVYSVLFAVYST